MSNPHNIPVYPPDLVELVRLLSCVQVGLDFSVGDEIDEDTVKTEGLQQLELAAREIAIAEAVEYGHTLQEIMQELDRQTVSFRKGSLTSDDIRDLLTTYRHRSEPGRVLRRAQAATYWDKCTETLFVTAEPYLEAARELGVGNAVITTACALN